MNRLPLLGCGGGSAGGGGGGGGGTQTSVWETVGWSTESTLTNGGRTANKAGSNGWVTRRTATDLPSGLSYFEIEVLTINNEGIIFGVSGSSQDTYIGNFGNDPAGIDSTGLQRGYGATGTEAGFSATAGDIIGVYVNKTVGRMWYTKDNSTFFGNASGSDNPATNTGGQDIAGSAAITYIGAAVSISGTSAVTLRAGTNIARSPVGSYVVLP